MSRPILIILISALVMLGPFTNNIMVPSLTSLATEMAHPRRWRVLTDLRAHGAKLLTVATITQIDDGSVSYAVGDGDGGSVSSVEVDSVVIATGLVADEGVADAFRSAGFEPTVIGDCKGVGYLEGAMRDGFHAGLAVG